MGTSDQGPPLVVCDAGPLIHLDELDALDLLADFAQVLVPDAVWREVVQHRPGLLLTDDTAARLAAGNLRIGTHGTIGILVRAIRRRQRTKEEVLEVLRSIPNRSTLHLKRSLLESVISEVEGSA
jgi:predicted nucleic acid-binding protein